MWDLGNNRQVNVRNFKGNFYVDIREMYYDKDGDLKPGKKGNPFYNNLYNLSEMNLLYNK